MSRFWPGFEPLCLTPGREAGFLSTRDPIGTSGAMRNSGDRMLGAQTPVFIGRGGGDPEYGGRFPTPGAASSTIAPSGSGRSTEGVTKGLRLVGMSSREARMYIAFLDAPRSAREAAEIAGLYRATGYRVLLRLLDRGLVVSNGQSPRRFQSMDPSVLFRRLELFYHDETEILGCIAEAFANRSQSSETGYLPRASQMEAPRILAPERRSTHPAILELSRAKRTVAAVVRPLATPVEYRTALARTLGQLSRNGVPIRLITDAMPGDYRFCRAVAREAGGTAQPIQVRHYSPVLSQLYSIDRQTIVRIPTLGASNRAPPVAVAITDRPRVQHLVTRFEALWAEAVGANGMLKSRREPNRLPTRIDNRLTASS